jgi:hypothetical protein
LLLSCKEAPAKISKYMINRLSLARCQHKPQIMRFWVLKFTVQAGL